MVPRSGTLLGSALFLVLTLAVPLAPGHTENAGRALPAPRSRSA
jgi:hypothetical protein